MRDAREQLIRLLPRLQRFALVLTRSSEAAGDLVQASLLRALERLDQFSDGTRLDRWMFQIMKTVWLNDRRAATIRQTDTLDSHLDRNALDGEVTMHAKLALKEVMAAFDRLPPEQHQALFVVSVEGYTYREASELLEIPIGTVISRLARGRAALMADLAAAEATVMMFKQKSG